jgi:Ca2+-binding RTX toxin-like protein
MAGNPLGRPIIKTMLVSADAQSETFTFDISGKSLRNMGWTRHTWSFVADNLSATLVFSSLTPTSTPPGWGPALDNVRLIETTPTCAGLVATIFGTPESDLLLGTGGNDVIQGHDGDDVIYGFGGHDVICGGSGSDVLLGGDGNDKLYGGPGRDTLLTFKVLEEMTCSTEGRTSIDAMGG